MKQLHWYVLKTIIANTLAALAFFTLVVVLLDLFNNISMYIAEDVSLGYISYITLLYIPKAMIYALSPAVLFGVTYSLAGMHANNELISILNSGISYYAFISVILVFGILISFVGFLFQEYVVIDTYAEKQDITEQVSGRMTSYNNSNVVLLSPDQQHIYYARYYNDQRRELTGFVALYRNAEGTLTSRIDARSATYNHQKGRWDLTEVTRYEILPDSVETSALQEFSLSSDEFVPSDFRDITYDIERMRLNEAKEHIERMGRLDSQRERSLKADYYERFAFSLTPFIVVLISCLLGTLFKKNILLYSLLVCIIISLLYYVAEMLTMLLAKQGFLPAAAGGWLPVVVFSIVGITALFKVRT
ncbi:MAG: LptF/LptG family permease [Spirochaetota bacterium]